MRLFFLRRSWNLFARKDPFWAILTDPDKRHRRWQPEEFFATGAADVAAMLQTVRASYPTLGHGQALDFGCGVGRLTQALARDFDQVVGIDLAKNMLSLARTYNRFGDRVQYLHNRHHHLGLLESDRFDFVCSLITLQHMEVALARSYIAEFVRVCTPGGIILFQIPAGELSPLPKLQFERLRFSSWPPTLFKRIGRILHQRFTHWKTLLGPTMEMHSIPRSEIVTLLETSGAQLLAVTPNGRAGAMYCSYDYVSVKRNPEGKCDLQARENTVADQATLHPR